MMQNSLEVAEDETTDNRRQLTLGDVEANLVRIASIISIIVGIASEIADVGRNAFYCLLLFSSYLSLP